MTNPPQDEPIRDVTKLVVQQMGHVSASDADELPWDLVLPDARTADVCRRFLREVHAHRGDLTVRSYAYDLLRYIRFLAAINVEWQHATPTVITDFFVWMKHAKKSNGSQNPKTRDSRISRNAVTGKPYVGEKFSPTTMDHNETVLRLFYEFLRRHGYVLLNPVTRGAPEDGRANAHQNPLRPRRRSRRNSNRQGSPKRLPRSIPDDQFERFFEALGNDRDRALVSIYVSSGARPSEVLNLDMQDIDLPNALITVQRKGGDIQVVPISHDAVAWYRLHQGASAHRTSGPAWQTLRGEPRPLTYDALRAMFRRANAKCRTNWTPHDLRHTAATRMLGQGTAPRVVQEILGHATLKTLEVYTVPRLDEMIAAVRATRDRDNVPAREPAALDYNTEDMSVLFGESDTPA
ncbi:tyrosine-type recombinase/integrase [Microbacterium aurugineum]|uniref:tyrosine-type recombinase/integrase n=1 Tax=Microbacterium aurugineum TaxID=2851642 RepID=UPI0020BE680E|nr:tyrosine-type recombinase/integrase [Microbacterium aurugineum]MCK8476471.1 tyrosine-type recombinase/integrase [Microbacterium aurugineum]